MATTDATATFSDSPNASSGGLLASSSIPGIPGPIHIDTQHEDVVHDAQMDYYGAKLATCSSDRTIKIYNIFESSYELIATLLGHEGPVWQVSWAHPKFGVILASCSFDGSVWLHRENRPNEWMTLYAARNLHDSSVNSVACAPQEFGLKVAAASSDGRVSILTLDSATHTWLIDYIPHVVCSMGVNAVAWAPYGAYYESSPTDSAAASTAIPNSTAPVSSSTADFSHTTTNSDSASSPVDADSIGASPRSMEAPRLVTGGCDNLVNFWMYSHGTWQPDPSPVSLDHTHSDWVRDVAWAPNLIPFHNTVASASEDGTVLIWKQTEKGGEWTASVMHTFDAPVWRVSWSITGHLLAVSSGDANVTLWKEGLDGQWSQVSTTTTGS